MSETLHVVCVHCDSTNRVPRQRLSDGARCGKCKQALFSGKPAEISESRFQRFVERNDVPVVVDFWASWCGPCKAFAPIYEQAAQALEPDVRLVKLNTEEAPALATRLGIRSIPTLAVFKGGQEVARQAGAMDLKSFQAWVQRSV